MSLYSKIFVLITQNLISHFTMALQVAEQWEQFFTAAGIPSAESETYAARFVTNCITKTMLPVLSKDYLIDLGVTIIGDILAIIQCAKSLSQPSSEATSTTITSSVLTMPPESLNKRPPIRPPQIMLDMTNQQFHKFRIDWGMFKQLMSILPSQIAAQLYSLCEDSVQNSILNINADFSLSVNKIWFKPLKPLWLNALILLYIVSTLPPYLNEKGNLCKLYCMTKICCSGLWIFMSLVSSWFTIHPCKGSINTRITQQKDQAHLHQQTDSAARISAYKKSRSNASKPCSGCGTTNHTNSQHSTVFPAWGKQCLNCNKQNHFAKVCCQTTQSQGSMNALIAHLRYDNISDTYTTMNNNNITEIPALISLHEWHKGKWPVTLPVFSDNGASLCLAGLKLLQALGVTKEILIPCNKIVTAIWGSKISCLG